MAFEAELLGLAGALREEGLSVGTSEFLDGVEALEAVGWTDPHVFRGALAATLAKSPEDRKVFELVFDRWLFRHAEAAAIELGVREGVGQPATDGTEEDADGAGQPAEGDGGAGEPEMGLDLEALQAAVLQAIRDGDEAAMRDLARLAIAAFGRQGQSSGVLGVDVQRIRRALDLRSAPARQPPEDVAEDPEAPPTREQVRAFEKHLRRELERLGIERTQQLPPKRPLTELDRALPSGPLADLAAVHRVVLQLKRRLATQGRQNQGARRHATVDVRATMRASLSTGGVPVELKFRPKRPKRPEIFVLCDVSTSVSSASVFFLSVLHALHDSFRRMRSFVFVERISEVTDLFERERDFAAVSRAISTDAGVADVSGYTDYGRVWREFIQETEDELHPRATVIVLGDARTNGRDPGAALFERLTLQAGRTFWLNPEPRLYWNYGDSVIATYEQFCEAFEVYNVSQLGDFVDLLARGAR